MFKILVYFGFYALSSTIISISCFPTPEHLHRRNPQTCPNPAVRVPWRNLSADEKRSYKESALCLMRAPSRMRFPGAITRYDDLVYVHQQQSSYPEGRDVWHVTGQFLAAHRLYCYLFELMMRNECGYNGRMAYWEEFSDAGNFRNSAFLRDFGGSGDSDGYVHDNEFSTIDLNLGPGLENHRRKLRRSINDTASAMGSQQYVDEAMSKNTFVEFLATIRSFSHLAGHNGVGGELGDVQTAPVDIIFFSHHIYIDYLWDKWQRARPEARLFDIQRSGYETQANPIVETNYMTDISFLGLAPSVPMYSALDTQGGFLCYVYE